MSKTYLDMEEIKVPDLINNTQFGENIQEQIKTINSNFSKLSNPDFHKGDNAPIADIYGYDLSKTPEELPEEYNIFKYIRKIINNLLNDNFGDINYSSSKFSLVHQKVQGYDKLFNYNEEDLSLTTDISGKCIPAEILKKFILYFTPIYIYDKSYYDDNQTYDKSVINHTGLYQIKHEVVNEDDSYILSLSLEKIDYIPSLILTEEGWQWQINDELKINAGGVDGKNGRDANIYIAYPDSKPSEIEGTDYLKFKVAAISGNSIIGDIEKFNNCPCFCCISSNDNNAGGDGNNTQRNELYLGLLYIEYDSDNSTSTLYAKYRELDHITASFTDTDFTTCMNNLGFKPNASGGLFTPHYVETTGSGYTISHRHYIKDIEGSLNIVPVQVPGIELSKELREELEENLQKCYIGYNTNIKGSLNVEGTTINIHCKGISDNKDNEIIISNNEENPTSTFPELYVKRSIMNNGNLAVAGLATFNDNVNVNGSITVAENISANSVNITEKLKAPNIIGDVKVDGDVTIGENSKPHSITITGNISAKAATIPKINNDTEVTGNLKANSASITNNLSAGTINGVNIGTGDNKILNVDSQECLYNGNKFKWRIKYWKKNGWVKVIIHATSGEKTSDILSGRNWRFRYNDNSGHKIKMGATIKDGDNYDTPINASNLFAGLPTPMDGLNGVICTYNEFIGEHFEGGPNKPTHVQWGIKYNDSNFQLIINQGYIHHLEGGKLCYWDYTPYLEFTYPTND